MPQSSHSPAQLASVILDFGADSAKFEPSGFNLNDQGMTLMTPWRFSEGTCLSVKVAAGGLGAVDMEAMVVRCKACDGRYHITVVFLDSLAHCCECHSGGTEENSDGPRTPLFEFSTN